MPDPNRPRKSKIDADPGFEVVEDIGFEAVDEAPPAPAGQRDKGSRQPVRAEVDEGPRPWQKKKKGKKKRRPEFVEDQSQASRDRALREFEWIWPTIILAIGLVSTIVGAIGVGGKAAALHSIFVILLGLLILIPATVATLMVVGILFGIEYGRFGPAILKIAAISFVANGIMFLGDWAHLPGMLIFPISCSISFALFMSQFGLDTWETNISAAALNVMSFVANLVLIGFLIVAAKKEGDSRPDPQDDAPPAEVQPEQMPNSGAPRSRPRPVPFEEPRDDE